VSRRLSLAGQLLALQVVIICVVLIGVAAVSVAQGNKRAQDSESRRALAAAETLANGVTFRAAMEDEEYRVVRVLAESNRSVIGSASVVVALADRTVVATADPEEVGHRFDVGESPVLDGRSWVGERTFQGRPGTIAMVPVLSREGDELLGLVAVQRVYPSLVEGLRAAAPNLLTYLGLASAIGIVGSLLVARRVKRQTHGLEPAEIAGLVEHREAMLHGIREGVIGLDPRGRVTMVNDEAIRLLRIPGDTLGRSLEDLGVGAELRDALGSVRSCVTRCSAARRRPTGWWRAPGGCSSSTAVRSPAAAGRSVP
jgi:two-component system, CitB family, sensor kinase